MNESDGPTVEPIRVIVVDDHEMVAESISRALERVDDIEVVATAGTCTDAVALANSHGPDVAVVDYQLPDGDGASLAGRIRDVSPRTQIVLLTGLLDERVVLEATDFGCAGFVTKDKAIDELVLAVRTVHAGEAYMPAALLAALMPRLRTSFRPFGADLTAREREVLGLLAEGLSNDAIAAELVLSRHTVRNHVQNVLTKLQAHSKLEAVALAVRQGLVQRRS